MTPTERPVLNTTRPPAATTRRSPYNTGMVKLAFFPVLLVAACVIAAAYGAIHNQLSYTVAPEFWNLLMVLQNELPSGMSHRAGASLVGILNSWWMGLVIGPPVLLVGLILPGWKSYVKHSLIAFAVVAATALLVGLGALGVAFLLVDESNARGSMFLSQAAGVRMERALTMHNYSYIGGYIGILTAAAYLIVARVRLAKRPGVSCG